MKKIVVLFAALVMALSFSGTAVAKDKVEPWTYCANTPSTPLTGTYKHVEVPEFASCYMEGAVVRGNFFARNTPKNVVLLDTEFKHNVMVNGATHQTTIGISGCNQDPVAGNNIKVTNSHNVLICEMSVDNNVVVKRNDGRISVFRNRVGNNIMVSRNKRYVPKAGDGTHRLAGAIRVRGNQADNHIQVFYNHATRHVIVKNNTPEPNVKLLD